MDDIEVSLVAVLGVVAAVLAAAAAYHLVHSLYLAMLFVVGGAVLVLSILHPKAV